ncbi:MULTISPECIES: hypothetical protein [unclassified Luteibacter]|uniref:hypothetical protein n=1 Tax=Luteibacter sp. PvP019 TaxID=3156436 RepID=UPI003391880A
MNAQPTPKYNTLKEISDLIAEMVRASGLALASGAFLGALVDAALLKRNMYIGIGLMVLAVIQTCISIWKYVAGLSQQVGNLGYILLCIAVLPFALTLGLVLVAAFHAGFGS